jgi:hypothetical protein
MVYTPLVAKYLPELITIGAIKSEYRNSKQIRITKIQLTETVA